MVLTQLDELAATVEAFRAHAPAVENAGRQLATVLASGGKILTCGNGGSATDAQHLAEELVGRFIGNRRSLAAISLSSDAALLTCIGNDYGFDAAFARQIEGLGQPGDALVVFTTSGKSANILAALETAKARGLVTIAVLGKGGGPCAGRADFEIIVPGQITARIQELHTFVLHCWLSLIEKELGLA